MNKLIGTLLLTLTAWPTLAFYNANWERPIRSANMNVVEARLEYEHVQDVKLTLNQRDDSTTPTSITLQFKTQNGETVTQTALVAGAPVADGCGSVQFQAALPMTGSTGSGVYERLNINITDHSHRICKDLQPNIWEASVRHGYGFCGTMDSTMKLVGNPEAVFTPMAAANLY